MLYFKYPYELKAVMLREAKALKAKLEKFSDDGLYNLLDDETQEILNNLRIQALDSEDDVISMEEC